MKKLIILSVMLIVGCNNSTEPFVFVCDEGLTAVDGECVFICEEGVTECYYQGDLEVLQDIIDVNESLSGEEPLEIGYQTWNDGRLTFLQLYNNNLTTLPESIGDLSSLESLSLIDNQLTTLPESIGDLSSLESLNLNGNQLTTLPESICNLPETVHIHLSNNQICSTIPSCMDWINHQDCGDINCPENLVEINEDCYYQSDLDVLQDIINLNESLTVEPLEIGKVWKNGRLIGLLASEILLENNQITTLPESIGNLSSLTVLHLYGCQITSLPEGIGNLSELIILNIGDNQLTSIPESIGNLSNLAYLHLASNQLTSVPESIGNLSSIGMLLLDENKLTTLPNTICNLPADGIIFVEGNHLCEEYHYECIYDINWVEQDQSKCCEGENGEPNWTQCP